MKLIAFILSLYILALNFTICTDIEDSNMLKTEITQSQDHEHNTSKDLCSPFCYCQCCQVLATNPLSFDFKLDINRVSNQTFLHFDSLGKEITFTILQPPRV
ncbi:MAG: hypothetical protein L3J14_07260 [Flavobacteriaceae bacterium]|nr:hypothetical protein [Flavobacteriaceae bacterium]